MNGVPSKDMVHRLPVGHHNAAIQRFPSIHDTSESSMRTRAETERQELLNDVQLLRHICGPCALSPEISFAAPPPGVEND